MQIGRIYEGLKDQMLGLAGMEKQIQDLLNTNEKNLQDTDCLKTTSNRKTYFQNQHQVFNVLMDATNDMKIINSYLLLETECQLRDEIGSKKTGMREEDTGLQIA